MYQPASERGVGYIRSARDREQTIILDINMLSTRHARRYAQRATVVFVVVWLFLAFMQFSEDDQQNNLHTLPRGDRITQSRRQPGAREESIRLREKKLAEYREAIYAIRRPPDAKYAINETRSQTIALDRVIPDNRSPQCHNKSYVLRNHKISVVIPMYNEAPSILLRAIHSIINRTPPHLLADVVIVDDVSTNENLKQPLTDYLQLLSSKIKLIRLRKKAHLVKARMFGATVATGDIIMFQDAHTEMGEGWSEPIIDYLQLHPDTVIQPVISTIDQTSLEYEKRDKKEVMWRGVFLWDMRYAWHKIPDHYRIWQSSASDPVPCPILVGCSIAVRKDYFKTIGGFDTGLDVWGGEQIELSFKTWMCGGRVVIHPCSHVGHIYKPWMKSDIDWRKREQAIAKNNIRVSESWMDRYATYYYASNRIYSFKQVDLTQQDLHGIAERRDFRRRMRCRSFQWYLNNVLPELKEPSLDAKFYGEVSNEASSSCFYVTEDLYVGLTRDCYLYSRFQDQGEFQFKTDGSVVYGSMCVIADEYLILKVQPCDMERPNPGIIQFQHLDGRALTSGRIIFYPADSGDQVRRPFCLEQITNALEFHYKEQMPQFRDCQDGNLFQIWNVNYHFDYNLVPEPYFHGDSRFISTSA